MIALPFSLPVGYFVPPSNVFGPNPQSVTKLLDLDLWFKQFILCGCGGIKDGQDWAVVIDGKIYVAIWRNRPPQPPWTMAVWDVYLFTPPCGSCPSVPIGLGWFHCWQDVIQVIKSEAMKSWHDQYEGAGSTVTVIGTNIFEDTTVKPQTPLLWLAEEKVVSAGKVVEWTDKSGKGNIVFQDNPVEAPSDVSFGGFSAVQFSGAEYLRLRLPAISQWHVFIVGYYNPSVANDWGTIFGAMGLVSPFSGVECLVAQNGNQVPQGSQGTFIFPNFVSGTLISPHSTLSLWEWKQDPSGSFIGKNAFLEKISSSVQNDGWNPMLLNGSTSLPVEASIGRSNRGSSLGQLFYWFEGGIMEMVAYGFPLKSGQRKQVLNYFRKKYNLGPVLA